MPAPRRSSGVARRVRQPIGSALKLACSLVRSQAGDRANPRLGSLRNRAARLVAGLIVFAILFSPSSRIRPRFGAGSWRTTNFGPAIDDPENFLITLLNGLTFAGLLFIVASGFSLDLRAHARDEHGARRVLPPRRLHRVRHAAVLGRTQAVSRPVVRDINAWEWLIPVARRHPLDRHLRPGRATGSPALEPGPGSPTSSDHHRALGHPRRPDHRALPRRTRSRSGGNVATWPIGSKSSSICMSSASSYSLPV